MTLSALPDRPRTTEGDVMDVSLLKKLLRIARRINNIEKRGRNDFQHYDYVQSVDVIRQIRNALYAERIIVLPEILDVREAPATGGKGFITVTTMIYEFVDTDTGASIPLKWAGAGSDIGGDKGLYKALTGALKYFLLDTFLIPTGDDPEKDQTTTPQGKQGVDRDATRAPAPRIPKDRAEKILRLAMEAGLASWEEGEDRRRSVVLSAILRAKLQVLGVELIGRLNADTAEDVEAFIASERAGS